MNILVVGQSHVAAIRAAARSRREADPARPRTRTIHTLEPQYAPEIVGEGEGAQFSPALAGTIREQVARHRPLVVSAMGGNAHNALALLRHARPFDFRLTREADRPFVTGSEPIPEALVRAALAGRLGHDRTRLRLLRELAGPFVHLESPPPVRDDDFIASRADAWFRERAGGAGEDGLPVPAPAALRWRIWRLNARLFREMAEAIGCGVLPVPAEVQDADGYLRPEFAADATHGNAAYGEAAIRALEVMGENPTSLFPGGGRGPVGKAPE